MPPAVTVPSPTSICSEPCLLGDGPQLSPDPPAPLLASAPGHGIRGAKDTRNVAPGVSECPQRSCFNVVTEGSSIVGVVEAPSAPLSQAPCPWPSPPCTHFTDRMGSRGRPRACRGPEADEGTRGPARFSISPPSIRPPPASTSEELPGFPDEEAVFLTIVRIIRLRGALVAARDSLQLRTAGLLLWTMGVPPRGGSSQPGSQPCLLRWRAGSFPVSHRESVRRSVCEGAGGGKPAFSPEEPGQRPALAPSPHHESSLETTLSDYFSETVTLSSPSERRFRAQRPDPREAMGTMRTRAGFPSSG